MIIDENLKKMLELQIKRVKLKGADSFIHCAPFLCLRYSASEEKYFENNNRGK